MSELLVSIITPSYEQAQFLEQTILSVLNQDYDRIECIVVDGGSTDGTLEILRRHQDRVFWISESDEGQSDAINKGWRRARGEILSYLNSDDTYLPGAIRTVVEFFTGHPEFTMVYGDCGLIDQSGDVVGSYDTEEFDLDRLINVRDFIPQPASFFRRQVLDTVGFLDTSLHYAMDYDFWIRIALRHRVVHLPALLANFRRHDQAKTSRGARDHWRENLLVSRRYGGRRFSSLYFRYLRHALYRHLPAPMRRLAKEPWLEPFARIWR